MISSAISRLVKIGPFTNRKARPPRGALVEDLRAEDVGRHQVGRELDPAPVEAEGAGGGFHQLGLGEARRADQQGVAAGEDGGEHQFDDALLAEHDLADLGADLGQQLYGGVSFLDDVLGGSVGAASLMLRIYLSVRRTRSRAAHVERDCPETPYRGRLRSWFPPCRWKRVWKSPVPCRRCICGTPPIAGTSGWKSAATAPGGRMACGSAGKSSFACSPRSSGAIPDGYYLVTPHEKVVVKVEDAPFVGVRADRHESDGHQVIVVTTNVGDVVAVDAEHPIRVVSNRQTGEPSTYVLVRGGLEARMARPPYYELVGWAEPDPADEGAMILASSGQTFQIGRVA